MVDSRNHTVTSSISHGCGARIDRQVGISAQHIARHIDAEGVICLDCAGIVGTVDTQRNNVARLNIAASSSCNGNNAGSFIDVENIISSNIVKRKRGRWRNCVQND